MKPRNLTAVSLLMLSVPILIVILLFGCSRLFWNTMHVVLLIFKEFVSPEPVFQYVQIHINVLHLACLLDET